MNSKSGKKSGHIIIQEQIRYAGNSGTYNSSLRNFNIDDINFISHNDYTLINNSHHKSQSLPSQDDYFLPPNFGTIGAYLKNFILVDKAGYLQRYIWG